MCPYRGKAGQQKQRDALGYVLLGMIRSCIHMDVTLHRNTYLNAVTDNVHPVIATLLCKSSDFIFQ